MFACISSHYTFSVSASKQLIYEKLPNDISQRHVLLLDPVLATGGLLLIYSIIHL